MIWALSWMALLLVRYAALFHRNRVRILIVLTGQLLIFASLETVLKDNASLLSQLVPVIALARKLAVVLSAAAIGCWALGSVFQVLGRPPSGTGDRCGGTDE